MAVRSSSPRFRDTSRPSSVDRRGLLARPAHTLVRDVGARRPTHGHARSFPHPHSRESGPAKDRARFVAVWLANRLAPAHRQLGAGKHRGASGAIAYTEGSLATCVRSIPSVGSDAFQTDPRAMLANHFFTRIERQIEQMLIAGFLRYFQLPTRAAAPPEFARRASGRKAGASPCTPTSCLPHPEGTRDRGLLRPQRGWLPSSPW